jgi:hypothetical protein
MGWGAGFYPPEADSWACWRWTDGHARLEPWLWAGIAGAFRLELHVFRTLEYRVEGTGEMKRGQRRVPLSAYPRACHHRAAAS